MTGDRRDDLDRRRRRRSSARTVVAFEDFDLDVHEREALCIVGPSGCGKTTLLRCIDGLIPLTRGTIRVRDEVVTRPHPNVALVFQHFGLFPWMTVQDNVAYGLRVTGVQEGASAWSAPSATSRWSASTGSRRSTRTSSPAACSSASASRGRSTMEPEVLLMDEPFASVDAQTREILQEQLLSDLGDQPPDDGLHHPQHRGGDPDG